jgi:hypothetical protein
MHGFNYLNLAGHMQINLIAVVGFECSWDPESYTDGSVATGKATQAGQVEG